MSNYFNEVSDHFNLHGTITTQGVTWMVGFNESEGVWQGIPDQAHSLLTGLIAIEAPTAADIRDMVLDW